MTKAWSHLTRRGVLAAAGALAAGPVRSQPARRTAARIVILGAGAAGLAAASRLTQRLDGADITLVDKRRQHFYQPGFTLIAAGLKDPSYSVSATRQHVARA